MVVQNRDARRAQVYLFEVLAAAILFFLAMSLLIQFVNGVPGQSHSYDADSAYGDTPREVVIDDFVSASTTTESIRQTLLAWNQSGSQFANASGAPAYHHLDAPPTSLSPLLVETYNNTGYTLDITLQSNETQRPLFDGGDGDENATHSSATTTVALYDSDRLSAGPNAGSPLHSADFYLDDQYPDSELYAVVHVTITMWEVETT